MKKKGESKRKKSRLQAKISFRVITLILAVIVLVSVGTIIQMKVMSHLVDEELEELAVKVSAESGLNSLNDKLRYYKADNEKVSILINVEFSNFMEVFFNVADQISSIADHPDRFVSYTKDSSEKTRTGELYTIRMTPEGDNKEMPDQELEEKIANVIPQIRRLAEDDKDIRDVTIGFPDGSSYIVNRKAGDLLDSDGNPIPYDVRSEEWYQEALGKKARETRIVFKAVSRTVLHDEQVITFAVPVYNGNDLTCVIAGTVRLKALLDVLEISAYGEGEYDLFVNRDGQIVASTVETGPLSMEHALEGNILDDIDLVQSVNGTDRKTDILSKQDGTALVKVDGKMYYATYAYTDIADWIQVRLTEEELFVKDTEELVNSIHEYAGSTIDRVEDSFIWTVKIIGLASLLLLIVAVLVSWQMSVSITRPVDRIRTKLEDISEQNVVFRMEPALMTNDEIQELAESFTLLTLELQERVREIIRVSKQKERMSTELSIAATIQTDLLPSDFPLFPDRDEFELFASMDPAREVGGDFYDAFLVDEDHLAMVVADVSDKGVPSALFMMVSKTLIRTRALQGGTPGEILTDVNNTLCGTNKAGMFVTVWLAILTISTGLVTESNAGHENPLICHANGEFEMIEKPHGLFMGEFEGMPYTDDSFTMEPGDVLFVHTDGVTEATDAEKELFGEERMIAALNAGKSLSPDKLLPAVRAEVDAFVGEAKQFDDLTMLAIRYKNNE
ncbi:MAG: SpoIIE family protein phosphatase [Eubacterium sp.]|nr:SpoIIE family protein phosphatase [Eubacterium sp.]